MATQPSTGKTETSARCGGAAVSEKRQPPVVSMAAASSQGAAHLPWDSSSRPAFTSATSLASLLAGRGPSLRRTVVVGRVQCG